MTINIVRQQDGIDRYFSQTLKVLRRIAAVFLLVFLLTLITAFMPVAPAPSHAQSPEEVLLYSEDFNDELAQGWDLTWDLKQQKGWQIVTVKEFAISVNYVLQGIGHYWARYPEGGWGDFRVSLRLSLEEEGSVIHLNYRLNDEGRYYIGFHGNGLYLSKESYTDTFHEELASSSVPHSYRAWHNVEIVGQGANIQVVVNGKLELDYTDKEPFLEGTIAFETLESAVVQLDDVTVIGPAPVQEGPDLAITATDKWEITEDGRVLLLIIEIENQGDATAQKTTIEAEEPERKWYSGIISVPVLAPLETTTVAVSFEVPDEQRGFEHIFQVHLDRENFVFDDFNRKNNEAMTPPIFIPALEAGGQQPRIEAVDPDHGWRGQQMTLMVYGENFIPGVEVFMIEGIDIIYVEYIDDNMLEIGINIGEQTMLGPNSVEVANPEGLWGVLEDGFTVLESTPTPEAQPDLVTSVSNLEITQDGRTLIIFAEVRNGGEAWAPETVVRAEEPARGWVSEDFPIPELEPGEETPVEIWLEIPDEQRGIAHALLVETDPEAHIRELNEENNVATTQAIFIPYREETPETPEPPIPPPPDWGVLTVVVAGVSLGSAFTVRYVIKVRRRRGWQKKAKREEPPKTCQPCTYHCSEIELELKPAHRKITHLNLTAYDSISGRQVKDKQVKGEIVNTLNKAVDAHRQNRELEKLQLLAQSTANTLLRQVREWLRSEPAPRDIRVIGHLAGSKATLQFILYHCRQRGNVNVWKKEDKWKATIKDEHDEPVGTLHNLDPNQPNIYEELTPDLTRLLSQFVEKV